MKTILTGLRPKGEDELDDQKLDHVVQEDMPASGPFKTYPDSIMYHDQSGYEDLKKILDLAYSQAANGKGKERHSDGKPFNEQPLFYIQDLVGSGFALGQSIKKISESTRLPKDRAIQELLGAIVYIAGAVIQLEKTDAVQK